MKKRSRWIVFYSIIGAVLLIMMMILFIISKNRVIKLVEKDEFLENIVVKYEPNNYVYNEEIATLIVKTAIKEFYDENLLLHGPYHVYFDAENNQWQVSAEGFFHGSAYFVIDAKDGKILYRGHSKF